MNQGGHPHVPRCIRWSTDLWRRRGGGRHQMAAAKFSAAVLRRCLSGYPDPAPRLRLLPRFLVDSPLRALSSGPVRGEDPPEGDTTFRSPPEDDLRVRIFRLRFPKRSATAALEKWVAEGRKVTASELRRIARELRRAQRYKHALEISEWMINHQEYEFSDGDYAVRIDLINKVFGVVAAEEFFEGLPAAAKSCETCTALLHAYAGAKLVEKAESLFERIKGWSITLSILTYNEMMTLYISVGQSDKVALLAEELKKCSVQPDLFTYNLRISACASTIDFDGVRSILDEMPCDPNCSEGWKTYIKLADIYIFTSGLKDTVNSLVEAEKITQREWITYDFLVILYTGLGNRERINEIWKSLRMASQKISSRSYVCIISSYLMLGHLREAGDIIDEWKQAKDVEFDISVCNRLYHAFLKTDLIPEAEIFHQLMLERNQELVNSHGIQ